MLTSSPHSNHVPSEHEDVEWPIWPIWNTIWENVMLKLSWKIGESKWNPCWLIMLTSSSGTNHVLNKHEDFDNMQGCTKLKSAWGLNCNINFRPDFHEIPMLSGKAQNVHFILSNIYIGLKLRTGFFFFFFVTTLKWMRKLSFGDHYEQWLLLIAKGTRQNNLIKESWKKEQNPGSWLRKKLQVTNNKCKIWSAVIHVEK